MTGGDAAQGGFEFQNKVAAYFAAHILAGSRVPFLELPDGVLLTRIELETTTAVDDILLLTSAGGLCFINVKRGVVPSGEYKSPIGSVLDQFVRQYLLSEQAQGTAQWDRPLNENTDRLVLVSGGQRSAVFCAAATKVLTRIRNSKTISSDHAQTQPEVSAYKTIISLLKEAWLKHTGREPDESNFVKFLSLIRVRHVDFDTDDSAQGVLSRELEDPSDAAMAWARLEANAKELSRKRSGMDSSSLRNDLQNHGVRLKNHPQYQADIETLKAHTAQTLRDLRHYSEIRIPGDAGDLHYIIPRDATRIIAEAAITQSFLLIGPPGGGKSGALYGAATALEKTNPVVVLAVDQHQIATPTELSTNLGLNHSLVDVLKNWQGARPGIIFIDALDASRGGPADKVFQLLIRRILSDVKNWHVVATIRSFDLRFGIAYRDLFRGEITGYDDLKSDEFPQVQHLEIPELKDSELNEIWSVSPRMSLAYKGAPAALQELLRQPFNLYLLGSILLANQGELGLSGIKTQIDLLGRYWSYRVIGSDYKSTLREAELEKIASAMIGQQTLSLRHQDLQLDADALYSLQTEGVLRPEGASGDLVRAIAFSHHVLFDYSVARLVFRAGEAKDLAQRLSQSHDSALMLAPAAIMALRMLWQKGTVDRRADFWEKAYQITSAADAGSFSKMLPARIAAELVRSISDYEIELEVLKDGSNKNHEAAKFINRHCLGALAVGIVPASNLVGPTAAEWTEVVRKISAMPSDQVVWSIKPITAKLNELLGQLTDKQRQDLSTIGRALLDRFVAKEHWDEGIISVALPAISRTAEFAPAESAAKLELLLTRQRLDKWGHQSLFTLSQESQQLGQKIPDFLMTLYAVVFGSSLPSRDEKRNMSGSRILSLVTNKRQDWELVQHTLANKFDRFVESAPIIATQALIQTIAFLSEARGSEEKLEEFEFLGVQSKYRRDYSSLWARRSNTYGRELLDGFGKAVGRLIEAGNVAVFKDVALKIAIENQNAGVWAALLRIGAQHPDVSAFLSPLLTVRSIIAGLDTRQPAGIFIEKIYPTLSEEDQRNIEAAILSCSTEDQRVLLNCIPRESKLGQQAARRRGELESRGGLAANRPPISVESGWVQGDEDWWLREGNVDLSDPANATINDLIKSLKNGTRPANDGEKRAYYEELWPEVLKLNQLIERAGTPDRLRQQGKDIVVEKCDEAALTCTSADEIAKFQGLREIVLDVLNSPEWDGEEANFDSRGVPSWSRPAPKVVAAEAVVALARAVDAPDEELRNHIRGLIRDISPINRFQVLARVNMLYSADPALMREICEYCFENEKQRGILSFFLNAFAQVIPLWPEWAAEKIVSLGREPVVPRDNSRDEMVEPLTHIALRLWIAHNQEAARGIVFDWISNPVERADELISLLHQLREAICQGEEEVFDKKVRVIAHEVFGGIIRSCASRFSEVSSLEGLSEDQRKDAETLLRVLDVAGTELYFGSGAYSDKSENGRIHLSADKRARFISQYDGVLRELASVGYPSITHHLLEVVESYISTDPGRAFSLFTAILGIGTKNGYQFESLGADLAVKIIRRFLADHKAVLTDSEQNRASLIGVLDAFVDAGWPEASRLVYQLPEMLR